MNVLLCLRALVAILWAFIFVGSYYVCFRREKKSDLHADSQRYVAYIPIYLPVFLAVLLLFSLPFLGLQQTVTSLINVSFGVFVQIFFYYIVLFIISPFLRKHISARACAVLWLVPNCLYITFCDWRFFSLDAPALVISIPNLAAAILFWIWLTGFLFVLLRSIVSHLCFRRQILKDAKPVTDSEILELWRWEHISGRFKGDNYQLVTSPAVQTPLSIGFFKRTIRVVLPEQDYTEEDLKLIFRHELIHIGRRDSFTKFCMTFFTAICWFNPLMWIAMKKSAEDLELSCDETVLLEQNESGRKKYAALILNTAGDQRGFTTCLAASSSSLSYRLRNIVAPKKRFTGGIIIGLALFLLYMTSGYVAMAYDHTTGAEAIFENRPEAYTLCDIRWKPQWDTMKSYTCSDPESMTEYLSDLNLSQITGSYFWDDSPWDVWFFYSGPEGDMVVYLRQTHITITYLDQDDAPQEKYYVETAIDRDYLYNLLGTAQ